MTRLFDCCEVNSVSYHGCWIFMLVTFNFDLSVYVSSTGMQLMLNSFLSVIVLGFLLAVHILVFHILSGFPWALQSPEKSWIMKKLRPIEVLKMAIDPEKSWFFIMTFESELCVVIDWSMWWCEPVLAGWMPCLTCHWVNRIKSPVGLLNLSLNPREVTVCVHPLWQ